MAAIPDEKVQEVRDRVDIVDLVGRYVELRRAGRNFKGLCPFHSERTPSFNVNPERKGYKCFGCGAGGDAIRFVMEAEGKSFPEAVRKLAELYGVHLPARTGRDPSGTTVSEKDEGYAITRLATELYERLLWDAPLAEAGRAYLRDRGIDEATARRFRLGYAPAPTENGWDTLVTALGREGLPLARAFGLGLVGRSERSNNHYDKFRGRLMFPVVAPGGEVVAFSGRVVPPHDVADPQGQAPPKYLNSPESILFSKGKTLFALDHARPAMRATKRAILVEGNVDVVKLHQWGHAEAVAPLGTALTADQARLLARFTDEVILCFDGDKAGKKAAWAALPLLMEADLDVAIVVLPEGEDPDSVGEARFGALLERAKPALEEMMIRIAARAGTAAHARARGVDRVVPLIARVQRESARALYIDRAAELFGLPASRIESAMRNALRAQGPAARDAGPAPADDARRPGAERHAPHPSGENPSLSRGPVTHSAAVRPEPLSPGQAQLTMLLVDIPHLAAVAERTGALQCITDVRLAPIAQAVIEGARQGVSPSMDDLLAHLDPPAQRQVFASVFSGGYRAEARGDDADPQALLRSLVLRCQEEALERQIKDVERQIVAAQEGGFRDQALALSNRRLQLRRQQVALHRQAAGEPAEPLPLTTDH